MYGVHTLVDALKCDKLQIQIIKMTTILFYRSAHSHLKQNIDYDLSETCLLKYHERQMSFDGTSHIILHMYIYIPHAKAL